MKKLNELTSSGSWELHVTLLDYSGKAYSAVYSAFKVQEAPLYKLQVSGYDASRSTLEDSLGPQNGMAFSTSDRDNDAMHYNCAERFR